MLEIFFERWSEVVANVANNEKKFSEIATRVTEALPAWAAAGTQGLVVFDVDDTVFNLRVMLGLREAILDYPNGRRSDELLHQRNGRFEYDVNQMIVDTIHRLEAAGVPYCFMTATVGHEGVDGKQSRLQELGLMGAHCEGLARTDADGKKVLFANADHIDQGADPRTFLVPTYLNPSKDFG